MIRSVSPQGTGSGLVPAPAGVARVIKDENEMELTVIQKNRDRSIAERDAAEPDGAVHVSTR